MMKHIKLYLVGLLALFSLIASPVSLAANIQVTVSKTKVVKNEVFQLRVVVDKKVSSDDIDFSVLEKDFYLGRPSFGTSINIINGSHSSRSEWNISLAAQRIGVVTIPAFTVGGATSQPITIQVNVDSNEPQVSDLVELQTSLDRQELYPNESALLKTRLVIKTDPRRLQNANIIPPQSNGLTLTALGEAKQYQAVSDGIEVTVVEQNYRVAANQPGNYSLSGIGFSGSVVHGNNRSGSTRLIDASTKAKQLEIVVNPIPEGYKGNWLPAANLALEQRWIDSEGHTISAGTYNTKVGESITREINLDIQGITAERFPNLTVNYPDSLRVYQEKPQFKEMGNGVTRMTLTQVLIPQQQGEINLNDISVNWWNSTNKQQESSNIDGITLSVSQGDSINVGEPAFVNNTPDPVDATVIKDTGIWPYLTALFGVLWLITLVLWRRATRAPTVTQPKVTASLSNKSHLTEALRQEDFVRTSYYAKEWLKEISIQDKSLLDAFNAELEGMNRHHYSASNDKWDNRTIFELISTIEKQAAQPKNASAKLPEL
ncbi:BatD family protein [Vibrio japonicus]|uniref:BatD family protein n=1 Tax=Vibrio japonicus TaxID=1824638 RepID=A0ABY5LML4_9VIBR|nr:BatD family protein [Vibrio japonicus]UUM32093.1 BatD family protein [Vibrio japonicus]